MQERITVGCDPEFFAVDKSGKFISLCGKIGGDKETPRAVDGGALLEDNVMLEINVQPASTAEEFSHNVRHVITMASKELSTQNLKLKIVSAADFLPDQMEDLRAHVFGCVPSFNAWTGDENTTFQLPENVRFAAGHIHVGFESANDHPLSRRYLVQALDIFLGLTSFIREKDKRRSGYYGSFGSYRPTSYGVEYRTPSNWWCKSERYMQYVFNAVQRAVNEHKHMSIHPRLREELSHNDMTVEKARAWCHYYGIKLP